ncbi:hypothetical protein [Denitromonas halophila]|uniref:Uncharacterized protein n=1 Tax=Denitromonas halophila TaxID=1629404 RepID=A0A557QXA5_9RHOO|nr:hypothetical protein [Denitromonas halophila]TVO57550.1 hypothetical protein FHP91_07690 [Denitromonas halophila]
MKKMVFALLAALSLTVAAQDHNYVMRDGMEYGYTMALTDEQRQAGQIGEQIIAFMYLGSREGKHQVLARDGSVVTVMECEVPCQFVKGMTFVDEDYLRDTIKVDRFQAQPGTIIGAVMDDVANNQLAVAGTLRNGKKHTMWMDARKGMVFYPAKK